MSDVPDAHALASVAGGTDGDKISEKNPPMTGSKPDSNPSSVPSTANIPTNINSNLPTYYNSRASSIISGPPLLGGPSANNSTGSGSTFPPYSFSAPQIENSSSSDMLPPAIPMPEQLQRNSSNGFNGYMYGQQQIGGQLPSNSGSVVPNIQSAGMMTSHIDFMNINSSPPLLSGGSQAVYLSNMGPKSGEGMPMMYTGIHNMPGQGPGSYTNLAAYGAAPMDTLSAANSGAVGMKRGAAGQGAGSTTKKAKTTTSRTRAPSYATNAADGVNPAHSTAGSAPPTTAAQGQGQGQVYYSMQQPAGVPQRPGLSAAPGQGPPGGPVNADQTAPGIPAAIPSAHAGAQRAVGDGLGPTVQGAGPVQPAMTPQMGQSGQLGQGGPMGLSAQVGSAVGVGQLGPTGQLPRQGGYQPPPSSAAGSMPPQHQLHQQSQQQQQQVQYSRMMPSQVPMQGFPQASSQSYPQYQAQGTGVPVGAVGTGQGAGSGAQDVNAKAPGGPADGQMQRPGIGMPGTQYGQYRPPLMPPTLQRGMSNTAMYVPGGSAQAAAQGGAPSSHQYQYQGYSQYGQAPQGQVPHQQMQMHGQYPPQGQWGTGPSGQQIPPQQHQLTGPPQVGQVVPQMLLNKGLPKVPRVRNKTPKLSKKALAAGAMVGLPGPAGEYGGPMDFNGAGETGKAMTYKERRAATSKKALAAAAEAERIRNGDVSVREETRRKEGKRDRESSQGDGEGRPEKEKVEKEESLSALLKRRDPIAARLEEIEVSRYMGRKCPPAPLPAVAPVMPSTEEGAEDNITSSTAWTNHTLAPVRADQRRKTHWDYVLDEVQWMAVDFRQELRWKLASARALAQACVTPSSACILRKSSSAGHGRSEADASQAKTAASKLSAGVAGYWSEWERTIARQAISPSIGSGDAASTAAAANETDATESHTGHCDLSKVTERILQLPSQLHAESDDSRSSATAGADTSKAEKGKAARAGRSPNKEKDKSAPAPVAEPEFPYVLQAHQIATVQKINLLNRLGFGAIMGGRSFVGKTVAVCSLLRKWLVPTAAALRPPLVTLIVAPQCLYRWTSQICAVGLAEQYVVWNAKDDACRLPETGVILVVPSDQLQEFVRSAAYAQLLPTRTDIVTANEGVGTDGEAGEEDAAPGQTHSVAAVIVDLRSTQRRELLGASPDDDSDSLLGQVGRFAAQVAPALSTRCVITEDASPQDTPLASLSFLCPGTSHRAWSDAYQLQHNLDTQVEQIKRNTLSQLIGNLSAVMKMMASADSVVAAQTRLEILASEMDIAQARLYNIVVSQILRHAAIYSGESTAKLARALLLLRRVCFHAALLSFKGEKRLDYVHGLRSAAQLNSSIGSSLDLQYADTAPYDRPAMSYAPVASMSVAVPPAGSTYWSTSAAVSSSGVSGVSLHPGNVSFHGGGLRLSASGASYRGGTFAQGPAARSDFLHCGSDLGSCKLTTLRKLLVRFEGLKLAILVDSTDELRLVQNTLALEGVEHTTAFCVDREGNSGGIGQGDRVEDWLRAQRAVEEFNLPSLTSGILLCSKHVFQPPSMHPHQADAVIVLSDDWLRCTEVKDCFRLRLLSAGPTGAPLTVVRVVAAGTIEERMARKGQSFLQLQGTPVAQLYPGLQELQTASPLPLSVGGMPRSASAPDMHAHGMPETQHLLHRAPTLVLIPIVVKSLSAMSRDGSTQNLQADNASTAAGAADGAEQSSEIGSHGQRGLSKGPVVLSRPGTGALARDQGTALRARSSIVSALSGLSSTDPLRQPDAQRWLAALRRDLRKAELAFEHRSESVVITAEKDLLLLSPVPTSGSKQASKMGRLASAGRYLLQRALARLLTSKPDGEQTTADVRRSSDQCVALRVVNVTVADSTAVKSMDDSDAERGELMRLTSQELLRLKHSGLSRTEPERLLLGHLLLPYYRSESFSNGLEAVRVKLESDTAPRPALVWPQSVHVLRDVVPELRRNGVDVDTKVGINPLATATRYDTVSGRSCGARDSVGASDVTIRYLHESSRNAMGQKGSSKPRRARPSGASTKKKDTTTKVTADGDAPTEGTTAAADAAVDAGNSFDIGFLSDLDPMGDSPQKSTKGSTMSSVVSSPAVGPSYTSKPATAAPEQTYDSSWHATEDDIIICTQNAFSDPHFKRTETWLNKALEQAKKRRRTATETRLRYTWLCTTGRTQQRLQDPVVIAQIEQLKSSVASRTAAMAANSPTPNPAAMASIPASSAAGGGGTDGRQ